MCCLMCAHFLGPCGSLPLPLPFPFFPFFLLRPLPTLRLCLFPMPPISILCHTVAFIDSIGYDHRSHALLTSHSNSLNKRHSSWHLIQEIYSLRRHPSPIQVLQVNQKGDLAIHQTASVTKRNHASFLENGGRLNNDSC